MHVVGRLLRPPPAAQLSARRSWGGPRRVTRGVAVALAVTLALVAWPSAGALECEGLALDDGCLFTITGGDTEDPGDGFAVTNADGVPLWDFVQARDLQAIGYPISQRWVDGPFTLQAFQKVILQWDPGKSRMNYYNTLDVLANRYPHIGAAQRAAAPGAGGRSGRGLRHHHPKPPGAAGPERGDQGPVPQRIRLAESLRPADPLRGARGRRQSARASKCCAPSARCS